MVGKGAMDVLGTWDGEVGEVNDAKVREHAMENIGVEGREKGEVTKKAKIKDWG